MEVLTPPVGASSKICGRAKINSYAAVTRMLLARNTIGGFLYDILYASLEIPEGTKMYRKLIWYNDYAL